MLHKLLIADLVLDVPQRLVDPLQSRLVGSDFGYGRPAVTPGFLEHVEFESDVTHFIGIGHACRLDAQDGDLVEQFTRGDGDEDVFHGGNASNSSRRVQTSPTLIRSITPGRSIFVAQGRRSGVEFRKAAAARGNASMHHCLER